MSPVRPPDIAELRTFCLAADLGSLGRAAMRLNLSQPALSKRLQALEALAGCRLLDRSARGVTLTDAGRRLYEPAQRALQGIVAVEAVLDGLAQTTGPVVLAASHSAAEAVIGTWLAGLRDPGLPPVELLTANSQVVRRLVAEGRAELGVAASRPGATPAPGVIEEALCRDEIVCGVPHGHPWARLPSVAVSELARTPIVVRDPGSNARWTVESVLEQAGLPAPPMLAQVSTPAAAMREAVERACPVLLSRRILEPDSRFAVVPLRGPRFERQYTLVLPAGRELADATSQLAAALREAF